MEAIKTYELNEIEELLNEFFQLEQVEAVALGGSRATKRNDAKSDYDLYIYLNGEIDEEIRRNILTKYCSYMEIGNHYWELEDDCTLISQTDIEIIYRSLEEMKEGLIRVVDECVPSTGYTTCMWHNLCTSVTLYDPNGKLEALRKTFMIPYPNKLKEQIINLNMELISSRMPSFDAQIKKAALRGDLVSVNHRITEFFACYFDILFAFNEQMHPGEKRMDQICLEICKKLPEDFKENIDLLLLSFGNGEQICTVVDKMVAKLKTLINSK